MKKEIKDLINRLRDHVGAAIVEHTDLVSDGRLLIDCLDASYELEEAYSIIDKMSHEGMLKPSQSDVEPKKELFEYYVVDALSDHRAIGVVQAAGINEAADIIKNSIKPNHFCVTHVHKLEFNDKGFCDIYSGF